MGATLGVARFIHDGMDILFLAPTEKPGQNYDYNVAFLTQTRGYGKVGTGFTGCGKTQHEGHGFSRATLGWS